MISQWVELLPHECGNLISNAQNPHEARLICTYLKSWALLMRSETRESCEAHGPAILALSKTVARTARGQGLLGLKMDWEHSCPIFHTTLSLHFILLFMFPIFTFYKINTTTDLLCFLFSFFILIPSIINTLVHIKLLLLIYSLTWLGT